MQVQQSPQMFQNMMQQSPQVANPMAQSLPQSGQQSGPPLPEDIAKGHQAVDATIDGLIKLVSKPQGELTKKDIFDETSEMIAHGAFPTLESKQQLIGELANLPENEDEIRKILGQHLLTASMFRSHFHNAFGAPQ